jgi:hypothetical protein
MTLTLLVCRATGAITIQTEGNYRSKLTSMRTMAYKVRGAAFNFGNGRVVAIASTCGDLACEGESSCLLIGSNCLGSSIEEESGGDGGGEDDGLHDE